MTKSIFKLSVLILSILFINSCSNNDDNTATRSSDKIEITIDNGTPFSYSTNIVATDYPLAAQTGFQCVFKITSKDDVSTDTFGFTYGITTDPCPVIIATPATFILNGPEIGALNIQGIDIDYNNAGNSITFTYNVFGNNPGDDIKIIFSGNYFDSLGVSHTISGDIDIKRS